MPNAQNQEMLESIKADLEASGAVWVVDYRGLTVKEIQQLRRNIREADGHMKVYKNTIMHLALSQQDLPTLDDLLAGPSAFVFAGNDVAASAKAVKEFAISGVARGLATSINGVPRGVAQVVSAVADQKEAA